MSMPFAPLPIEAWPRADAERWKNSKAGGKLFRKGGSADWRPATRRKTEYAYGVNLGWQIRHGMLVPDQCMEQRVTADLIEKFVAEYQLGRAPLTVATTIQGVAQMMRACIPPHGVEWLSGLAWSMMDSAKAVRPKLPRIAAPEELLELAHRLMHEGREAFEVGRQGAPTYRNGLMIACLTARPMRLSEFRALRLGSTFVRKKRGWLIDIPPGMTKKKRRRRQFFPEALTGAIDYYVDHLRVPLLSRHASADNGALWVGRDGPLLPTSVSNIIGTVTLAHLGKRISPHLFRDCAATAIALVDPKHIGITKSILGHATLRSSQEHYNQAKGYSASADLAKVISNLRNGS